MSIFSLKAKTVVITGGAGYLGTAMSEALVEYGANLYILGQDNKKNKDMAAALKEKFPCSFCVGGEMNISDSESIKNVMSDIYKQQGAIDVLINNAAFSCPGPVDAIDPLDWDEGINGTINSTFRVSQVALQYMLKQGHGNIINIASMYGMVSPNPEVYINNSFSNPANYGAGKAAVIQFTKYLAGNYGSKGIRANAISPGPFPNKTVQKDKTFINALASKNPMNRIGVPDDLKGIIVFLASDSSSYINGQNIAVDGGWTIW